MPAKGVMHVSRFWKVTWIALLLSLCALPMGAVSPQSLPEHGFTLKTRFTWDGTGPAGKEGLWLVGASADPDAAPSFLGIAWSPVRDGWFGEVWGLQLVSDAGLFPSDARPARSPAGLLAKAEYVSLTVTKPDAGHEYEATLGYSPATGHAGVEVTDLTTGKLIARKSFELHPSTVPLFAGRGDSAGTLEVIGANLPLGLEWLVTQATGEEEGARPVASLNRQRPAELQLHLPWADLPGELTVLLEDGSVAHRLLQVADAHHLDKYTIALSDVPPGDYSMVTRYAQGGGEWEVARTRLTVGQVQLGLRNVELTGEAIPELRVRGEVTIATDHELTLPAIGVRARLDRHDFALPRLVGSGSVETTTAWQEEIVQAVEPGVAVLPFELQLPAGFDSGDTVWQLSVEPIAEPDTLVSEAGGTDIWIGKTDKAFSWDGLLETTMEHHMTIVPGVELYWATGQIAAGPIDMFVLAVDLSQPGIYMETMVGDRFFSAAEGWPRSRISDMVMRDGAVAGVNGAFYFLDTSLPRSMVLRNWEVLRSPGPPDNGVLGITHDGKAYIGLWEWEGKVISESGKSVPLAGINPRTHGRHGVVLYRPPWRVSPGNIGPDIDPLTDQVVELVIADLVQAGPGRIVGRVTDILENEPGVLLSDSVAVLSGRGDGATFLREAFAVGDTVELEYTLPPAQDWPDLPGVDALPTAVSGGVILVRDGVYGGPHVTADTGRHPRAAVGVSYDRQTLYFLVADGRSHRSVGLTYKELADFFLHIGAFEALNLDSGGSSTLSIRPYGTEPARAVNNPSDGSERFVADGIGVFYDPNE